MMQSRRWTTYTTLALFTTVVLPASAGEEGKSNGRSYDSDSSSPGAGRSRVKPPSWSTANKRCARVFWLEGQRQQQARQLRAALGSFRKAHDCVAIPTTRLSIAQALANLGRLVEARSVARKVTSMPVYEGEPEIFARARRDAAALAGQLQTRIARLRVRVPHATRGSMKLRVDGQPVALTKAPIELDPGEHTIVALAGARRIEKRIDLREGQRQILLLDVGTQHQDESGDRSDRPLGAGAGAAIPMTPLAWTGFGVSAAGVVAGAIAGGMAIRRMSEIEEDCAGAAQGCVPQHADYKTTEILAHTSTAGFAVAGAGAITGLIGLFLAEQNGNAADSAPATATLQPSIGLASVGLTGHF